MKKYMIAVSGLVLCIYALPGLTGEGHDNVARMAQITKTINHYPNNADKNVLRNIINDKGTNTHTRNLANAILNMQHKVSDSDRENLRAIMNDSSADEEERQLAGVLVKFNHQPSSEQKRVLDSIR